MGKNLFEGVEMKKFFFIKYSGRIIEKAHCTQEDIEKAMSLYPNAKYDEVDEKTYRYMRVGDPW